MCTLVPLQGSDSSFFFFWQPRKKKKKKKKLAITYVTVWQWCPLTKWTWGLVDDGRCVQLCASRSHCDRRTSKLILYFSCFSITFALIRTQKKNHHTHTHTHTRQSDQQQKAPGSEAGGTQRSSGTRAEEQGVALLIHNNNKEHENTAALYSRQHKQQVRHQLEWCNGGKQLLAVVSI